LCGGELYAWEEEHTSMPILSVSFLLVDCRLVLGDFGSVAFDIIDTSPFVS